MNIGLGNLSTLKAWLLAEELRTDTDFDDAIAQIGRGVAGMFEKYCGRKFVRVVGVTTNERADQLHVSLPIYPIEGVPTVELRTDLVSGWIPVDNAVQQLDEKAGLVFFDGLLGGSLAYVRLTWTGGYWIDVTEDNSGTQPAGSEGLPDDLKLAWLQQCRAVWESIPKLGSSIAAVKEPFIVGTAFTTPVEETLKNYRRLGLA